MKKIILPALAGLVISASALAVTPPKYDTKFNVSANVPDSVRLADENGNSITDMDVELVAKGDKMEATTKRLMLWNNSSDITKLNVQLTLDDSVKATGAPFNLSTINSSNKLDDMEYTITAITKGDPQEFSNSGDTKNYTLEAQTDHSSLPIAFRFVSVKDVKNLGEGHYSGIVYANLNAVP